MQPFFILPPLAQTATSLHSSPRKGNEISDTDVDFAVACGFFTPDWLKENLSGGSYPAGADGIVPRWRERPRPQLARTSSSVHSSPRKGNEISDTDVDFAVACGFFTPDRLKENLSGGSCPIGADVLVRAIAPHRTSHHNHQLQSGKGE